MYVRIGNAIGSTVQLVGAFAIGGALHQSLLEGTIALTAPLTVVWIALGVGLIALGQGLERRYGSDPRSDDTGRERDTNGNNDRGGGRTENGSDGHEFDERWAPFDAADLEKYERDEEYDATRSERR